MSIGFYDEDLQATLLSELAKSFPAFVRENTLLSNSPERSGQFNLAYLADHGYICGPSGEAEGEQLVRITAKGIDYLRDKCLPCHP